jgi:hypothetical protein
LAGGNIIRQTFGGNKMNCSKNTLVGFCVLIVSVLQFGCGGESGTNAPATKLTASVVSSDADATAHVHTVTVPFTDVSAAPASDVYQFRSEVTNGHSHVVAISKQQMIDLNNGMRLTLTSSTPNPGTSHTHSWIIYERSHSYAKRSKYPQTNGLS